MVKVDFEFAIKILGAQAVSIFDKGRVFALSIGLPQCRYFILSTVPIKVSMDLVNAFDFCCICQKLPEIVSQCFAVLEVQLEGLSTELDCPGPTVGWLPVSHYVLLLSHVLLSSG